MISELPLGLAAQFVLIPFFSGFLFMGGIWFFKSIVHDGRNDHLIIPSILIMLVSFVLMYVSLFNIAEKLL